MRYETLDSLRGFALINMIAYHACYDLYYIFGLSGSMSWYRSTGAFIWQQAICMTFILLAGGCVSLGKRPLRRGAIVLGCGLAITLGTAVFMPSELILFGVLHFIGCAMLITGALKGPLSMLPPLPAAVTSLLAFICTRSITSGTVYLPTTGMTRLPASLYQSDWLFWLGFPSAGFSSADYFPILPWIFLFLTGFFAMRMISENIQNRNDHPALHIKVPVLSFCGRYSLYIYMAHQPVIYGLLLVVTALS